MSEQKANGEEKRPNTIEVGKLYLVEKEGKLIGTEVLFADNIENIQGGMQVLDLLRNSLNYSGWTFETLARLVPRKSASAEPTVDSATSNESSADKKQDDGDTNKDTKDTSVQP